VNPGVARIAIVVVLALAGAGVIAGGFPGSAGRIGASGPTGSPSPDGSPSPTGTKTRSPKEEVPDPQRPRDIEFYVLNGTTVAGLAGAQAERLEREGFAPALNEEGFAAGDAPSKPVGKTVVYFRPGDEAAQNAADARLIAETFYDGAPVRRLVADFSTVVPEQAQVVVVLGNDFAR
jgi:hypothetical protein